MPMNTEKVDSPSIDQFAVLLLVAQVHVSNHANYTCVVRSQAT